MRKLLLPLLFFGLLGCDENETPLVYTNIQQEFELVSASQFPISGTATFLERRDGLVEVRLELTGTEGNIQHPAHLHYGDVSNPDAVIAAVLDPVQGTTGKSTTLLNKLSDESAFTYEDVADFNGHIKVHQDGGPNKNVILAGGNIGSAVSKPNAAGRVEISVCRSE